MIDTVSQYYFIKLNIVELQCKPSTWGGGWGSVFAIIMAWPEAMVA